MDLLDLETTPVGDNKTVRIKKKEKNIVTQIKQTYVNINSSNRNLITSNILDTKSYNLGNNPLYITEGSNLININIPNHTLNIDYKIILN